MGEDTEHRPLADRLRPISFDNYLGQDELIGEDTPLRKLIEADKIPSMILWGPPGSGKTTLANLVARHVSADFITLSAVTSSIRDVRNTIDVAKTNLKFGRKTILFIDEIHRFNKSQQDAFLPHVESGIVTLIGATTENPSFSVIAPLLSRCRVFTLNALEEEAMVSLLRKGLEKLNSENKEKGRELEADEEALFHITKLSDGDARRALGILEISCSVKMASKDKGTITVQNIADVAQRHLIYDKSGEEHYNLISALHKCVRSSDPHGALYWLARMLTAGEEPLFIARRLVRMASEDIGLANPHALTQCMEALRTYQLLGSPEGELALAQATVYLATSPKSNAVYKAYSEAMAEVQASGSLPVPMHLRNAPTKLMKESGYSDGYTYDHDFDGHFAPKQGLPDKIAARKFYEPTDQGIEAKIREKLNAWDHARAEKRNEDQS